MPIKKVKKVAAKKKETKKPALQAASVKKGSKKKPLVIVSGEMCFWVDNGPSLSSMKELYDALRAMSVEQYLHHTGMGRNDFSAWVSGALGDEKCAADLLKAKSMKSALSAVKKHLKAYSM